MVFWYGIRIAIIGSFCYCTAKAQKVVPGFYISSKGFSYDPYYEKAILTNSDSLLLGKAAFILSLAQALCSQSSPDTLRNLHLLPPGEWPPVYYQVSRLHLHAERYPILYARSNRLITEEGYKLKASVILQKVVFSDTVQRAYELALPVSGWKEALIDSLGRYLREL